MLRARWQDPTTHDQLTFSATKCTGQTKIVRTSSPPPGGVSPQPPQKSMPARRLDEDGDNELVPGECELKTLTATRIQPMVVLAETFTFVLSSWSIDSSERFDEGLICGKVDDRTTSVTAFEQALERRDGRGFGSPLFWEVSHRTLGGIVGTQISSSTVTGVSVKSFSGAPGDAQPAEMGFGRTFFTSHVQFSDPDGLLLSLPLLFHDHAGCVDDEDVDIDVYGSAVLGYAEYFGGNVTYLPVAAATNGELDFTSSNGYNVIQLSRDALLDYLVNIQARCDVENEPVWDEETGYVMCDGAGSVFSFFAPPTFPNVTTSVGGCPISVLPARFATVGDFVDGTFDSRLNLWFDFFNRAQDLGLVQIIDAAASEGTATSPFLQSSTQVGFALPEANNSTEWVLVLVVAVESLFVVLTALAALAFSATKGFVRRGPTPPREWAAVFGTVFVLGAFLALGLTPVFIGWASEREAAGMAHNDVYVYMADESVCAEVIWQGDPVGLGEWCVTVRTSTETLLVRSYVSTFEGRYAALAVSSAVLGGAAWIIYAVMKTLFVERVNRSVGAVSAVSMEGGSEARTDFREPRV